MKIAAILLAGAMAFTLAACGSSDTTESAASESASAAETEAPSESESAEPAETEDKESPAADGVGETDGEVDVSEEPAEEESGQQESEPAEAEENQEEGDEQTETPIELPSYGTVYEMADQLTMWVNHMENPGTDRILLDVNQAAEIAAISWFGQNMSQGQLELVEFEPVDSFYFYYIYPENLLAEHMQSIFGSQFQLSDYTKSERIPEFDNALHMFLCREDGQFHFYIDATGWSMSSRVTVEDVSECTEGYAVCTATVLYDLYVSEYGMPEDDMDDYTVEFGLIPDSSSVYGWAITSVQFK